MKKKTNKGLKIVCLNRKAKFNYFLEEFFEAGLVLKGSEVKSIRNGKINISDSYVVEKNGNIVLINSHISSYKESSYNDHEPNDDRKLLLNINFPYPLRGSVPSNNLIILFSVTVCVLILCSAKYLSLLSLGKFGFKFMKFI